MRRFPQGGLALLLILLAGLHGLGPSYAQVPASRIALVIGNGAYRSAVNATAPNDAGLVAQTLTAAGFDVSGARDLDGEGTRKAFRDFLDRAAQLGPQGIAFVYLAGYGVQYNGDNYFVPVDATLARDTDVPIQAIRVADLTQALAGLPIQSRVVVLDAAYRSSFPGTKALPGGFALIDPDPQTLLAFNAAPGTVGPPADGSYGVYSQALAEMMRQGGVPVQEVFDRVRLRVNTLTQGADVPWNESKLSNSFVFLQLSPDAPPPNTNQLNYSALEKRPIREFPATEAYSVAVARDSFAGYQDFLTVYPNSPYVGRVRILLAARREALTWRKTVDVGTGEAYWSYLKRYRRGPHAAEAPRLRALDLALTPPRAFAPVDYDVPPPPEREYRYVDEPVIMFNEADEPPPPPPPVYVLPPPDVDYNDYPPPPPPEAPGFLPIPIPVPIPYGRPFGEPGRLRPPPGLPGDYAQPQPFLVNPEGGLRPRPAPVAPVESAPRRPVPPAGTGPGQPVLPPGAPPVNRPVPLPAPLPGQGGVPAVPVLPNAGRPGVLPGTPGEGLLPPRGAPTLPAPPRPVAPAVPGQSPAVPRPGAPGVGGLPVRPPPQLPVPVPGVPGAGTQPPRGAPTIAVPAAPGQRAPAPLPGAPGTGALPVRPPVLHPVPLPGQPPAGAPVRQPVAPGAAQQEQQRQQQEQVRQQQLQQQQRQQLDQARQQQLQQQQRQQLDQAHQQQLQQQQRQQQQQDQARQQQLQQQQRQQQDQARQQQLQQQQRQQQDQARQQQLQQQQRQQQDQARQQQLQQQQRQQQDQARQQQLQQQQRQQQDQARQQQLQQQQRQQLDQARQQQQQRQPAPAPVPGPAQARPKCGKPGEPPCR